MPLEDFLPQWEAALKEEIPGLPVLQKHDLLARLPDQRVDKRELTYRLFAEEARDAKDHERVAQSFVAAYFPLYLKTVFLVYKTNSLKLPEPSEVLKAWNDRAKQSVANLVAST